MFTQYRIGFRADKKDIWYSMNSSSTEREQGVHTHRTSCRSGWPRGFGELNPSPLPNTHFVLVGSSPRSYLFTSVTVRIPVHTAPKCGTAPIQCVTLYFRDRRGAASHRYRIRAEITVLMCEQKYYPGWFSLRYKSYLVYCQHDLFPQPFRLIRDRILDKRNNTAINQSSL